MEDYINTLINELKLKQAQPDEFYGERDSQPLILMCLNVYPPGIMFKIRVNKEDEHDLQISELPANDEIEISVENGYGWLTIRNVVDYTVEDVIHLLDVFLQALGDEQLSVDERCAICHKNEDAETCYSQGRVSRICKSCAALVEQKRLEKQKELDRRKYIYAIFIPIAVAIFSLGWVLFWFAYDLSFELSRTDSVDVTDIGLVAGSIVVSLALGLPAGFLLRRLCIRNRILLSIIAPLVVIIGCGLGEIIHLCIFIYREYRIIDVMGTIRALPHYWSGASEGEIIIKITIILLSTLIIYFTAKTKQPTVEI